MVCVTGDSVCNTGSTTVVSDTAEECYSDEADCTDPGALNWLKEFYDDDDPLGEEGRSAGADHPWRVATGLDPGGGTPVRVRTSAAAAGQSDLIALSVVCMQARKGIPVRGSRFFSQPKSPKISQCH